MPGNAFLIYLVIMIPLPSPFATLCFDSPLLRNPFRHQQASSTYRNCNHGRERFPGASADVLNNKRSGILLEPSSWMPKSNRDSPLLCTHKEQNILVVVTERQRLLYFTGKSIDRQMIKGAKKAAHSVYVATAIKLCNIMQFKVITRCGMTTSKFTDYVTKNVELERGYKMRQWRKMKWREMINPPLMVTEFSQQKLQRW